MELNLPLAEFAENHSLLGQGSVRDLDWLPASLGEFESHGLASAAEDLMSDRQDAKYLMPVSLLPSFIEGLRSEFTVLEHSGSRCFTYENTYLDTAQLDCFLQHHNGRLERIKLRHRRYRESETAFLDLKRKNNKRRTLKSRVPCADGQESFFIDSELLPRELRSAKWSPSLDVNYRRISLWNPVTADRLTIDFDIRYQSPDGQRSATISQIFVAELKRQGKLSSSRFYREAKTFSYLPTSFSKYCVGLLLTNNMPKKTNNFKPLLRRLRRYGIESSTER